MSHKPRIIIHGGAGALDRSNLPPALYAAYKHALLSILRSTYSLLLPPTSATAPATALTAATHALTLLESHPLFNCGVGAVFTRAGTIELEASVMVSRGMRKRGVGVAGLKHVRHPIQLAKEILVRGERGGGGGAQGHVMLGGDGCEALAREWGVETCEEEVFWTRRRWDEHLRGLEREGGGEADGGDRDGGEYLSQGTAGCVVLDRWGTLCVATSTGGLTNKLPGRIGDTPTVGAGFWAEEWDVEVPGIVDTGGEAAEAGWGRVLPEGWRTALGECLPAFAGYTHVEPDRTDEKRETGTRAVAMSGTGNGDSFLRLAAARTAGAIARFAEGERRSLASAVTQIAGPGGELQRSAGDRWGKTGEGEGGIVGIELVDGEGKIVADFNCGGMFRTWIDDEGEERIMVFRDEY